MRTTLIITALILAFAAEAQQRDEIALELHPGGTPSESITVSDEFVRAAKFATKYFELGDMSSAYERLREAATMVPNHPAIIYNTAVVLVRMGRYAEAEEQIATYLSLFPDGAEAPQVKNLQIDLEFQRDLQKKQQANQNYIELFNRARFAYEQGDYPQALNLFQQAEQLHPDDAPAVYNQALAHEALGNYEKSTERLRHYLAVSRDTTRKAEVDRKIFQLEAEIASRKTSFVCPFCGLKLAIGTTWCHRCWHGPYDLESPRLNTLPCGVGASATRTSFYSEDRLARNETLPCEIRAENYLEQVRYSKGRQRAVQEARRQEGWTYRGDVIHAKEEDGEVRVELIQGDYLQHLLARDSGDALGFLASPHGEGVWLLDREELVIDGRTYVKTYQYDEAGRIVAERVRYQNDAACGHVIETTATYVREGDRIVRVDFSGGNTGFTLEGEPTTSWAAALTRSFDEGGRIDRETFEMSRYDKIYKERPQGPMREDVKRMYPQSRPGREMDILRKGDLCAMVGNRLVSNPIDLRPFQSIAPNLALLIPPGVVKIAVDYNYPTEFSLPAATTLGGR